MLAVRVRFNVKIVRYFRYRRGREGHATSIILLSGRPRLVVWIDRNSLGSEEDSLLYRERRRLETAEERERGLQVERERQRRRRLNESPMAQEGEFGVWL